MDLTVPTDYGQSDIPILSISLLSDEQLHKIIIQTQHEHLKFIHVVGSSLDEILLYGYFVG
jgi:hypothetical protein